MTKKYWILLAIACLFVSGCSSDKSAHCLKVAATAVPHAQMLEFIKPTLKAEGIDLCIVVINDYNIPNRALAQKEVAANFFQHLPFLQEQIRQFHYPIQSIGKIEIEPMGLYSKKIKSLSQLKKGDTIAIPNDPTNETRALLLLQTHHLITLNETNTLHATPLDIIENPYDLKFIQVDAAMLPRSLTDVTAAVINTNYALQADLSPEKDALALENRDSPYANVLVVREGEEHLPEIVALKKALTSSEMKEFIEKTYHGAVIPSF